MTASLQSVPSAVFTSSARAALSNASRWYRERSERMTLARRLARSCPSAAVSDFAGSCTCDPAPDIADAGATAVALCDLSDRGAVSTLAWRAAGCAVFVTAPGACVPVFATGCETAAGATAGAGRPAVILGKDVVGPVGGGVAP